MLGSSVRIPLFPFVLAATPIETVVSLGGLITLSVVSFFATLMAVWAVVRFEDTGTVPKKVVVLLLAPIIFIPALLTLMYSPYQNRTEFWDVFVAQYFFQGMFSAFLELAAAVGIGALGLLVLRHRDGADRGDPWSHGGSPAHLGPPVGDTRKP